MLLMHVSSIKNSGKGSFWVQEVALKKSMKIVEIYTSFLLSKTKKTVKRVHFINF